MKSLFTINILFLLFLNVFSQSSTSDIEIIIKTFNGDKYFSTIIETLYEEFNDNHIKPPCAKSLIKERHLDAFGVNTLLIPQIVIENTKMDGRVFRFDSIQAINRAIVFNKNKYLGSLNFTKEHNIMFCSCKTNVYSNIFCHLYVQRVKGYKKSLQNLLKKEPIFIFKDPNFEYVWFYVDKKKQIFVLTYDSECFELDAFFKQKDLIQYSLPSVSIKSFKE